jgi:hypothetical protein
MAGHTGGGARVPGVVGERPKPRGIKSNGDLVELVMASKRPIAARSELAESGQEAAAARRSLDASASACACEDERKKGESERDGSGRA